MQVIRAMMVANAFIVRVAVYGGVMCRASLRFDTRRRQAFRDKAARGTLAARVHE